tara:strand:+ start:338 stop:2035 length:1698 start_codon:yes stop_codon:yes gene_type:complete
MQQVSVSQISQAGQANALPFDFGMTAAEGQEFYDILKSTMIELTPADEESSNQIINQKMADSLEYIKQNMPDKLMAKIKEDLAKENQDHSDEELSAKVFAVLNLVDNIINNMDEVEDQSQLESSMSSSGISQTNIETTMQILDSSTKTTDTSLQAAQQEITTKKVIKNHLIEQFKINEKTNAQFLAEDIAAGKTINLKTTDVTGDKNVKNDTNVINTANTINNQNTVNDKNSITIPNEIINQSNQQKETKAEGKTLAEMLNLFKKTKQAAENQGLNLNADKKVDTTPAEKIEASLPQANNSTEKSIGISANNTQVQTGQAMQQEALITKKEENTHGSINKSEFKDLSSKFVADLSEEAPTEEPIIPEEVKAINKTINTEAHAQITKTVIDQKVAFSNSITNEITEAAEIEQMEKTQEAQQTQENKQPTSNFNMQLYKLAQQANVQNQVNIAIKNLKDQNMQQIKVKLNPEELGNISIEMELVDSSARGVITVERPEVAQQLAQNLKDIFQSFKQAGVNVDIKDIVVKVDDQTKQQSQQHQEHADNQQAHEIEYTFSENDLIDIRV